MDLQRDSGQSGLVFGLTRRRHRQATSGSPFDVADRRADLQAALFRIAALISAGEEAVWAEAIRRHAAHIAQSSSTEELATSLNNFLRIYGGMGSFSDVVLQSNGRFLQGNDELAALRTAAWLDATGLVRELQEAAK